MNWFEYFLQFTDPKERPMKRIEFTSVRPGSVRQRADFHVRPSETKSKKVYVRVPQEFSVGVRLEWQEAAELAREIYSAAVGARDKTIPAKKAFVKLASGRLIEVPIPEGEEPQYAFIEDPRRS